MAIGKKHLNRERREYIMVINYEMIRRYVDEPYLSRGKKYFIEGMVELHSLTPHSVIARAVGSRLYKIILRSNKNGFSGTCTCPAFSDFGPCKHIAAVAFALIEYTTNSYRPSDDFFEAAEQFEDLEKILKKKSKSALIDFIISLLNDYPEIEDEIHGIKL